MQKALKQEQELLKNKSAIEEKRRNQLRMEQELKAKAEEELHLQQIFSSQKEELTVKTDEIGKLDRKISMATNELEDL